MSCPRLLLACMLAATMCFPKHILMAGPDVSSEKIEVMQKDSVTNNTDRVEPHSDKDETVDENMKSKTSYNLFFFLIYQFLKRNTFTSTP
jgi:hypothetical protein